MFYESSFIKTLLKCHHCKLAYKSHEQPRTLPCCGQILCTDCVNEIEIEKVKHQYTCILCKEVDLMPIKGFPVSKLAAQLIAEQPQEVSRGEKHQKLKSLVNELKQLSNQLSIEIESSVEEVIKQHHSQGNIKTGVCVKM